MSLRPIHIVAGLFLAMSSAGFIGWKASRVASEEQRLRADYATLQHEHQDLQKEFDKLTKEYDKCQARQPWDRPGRPIGNAPGGVGSSPTPVDK
jgi:uncharacterized protein YlxW (UPF0749 family)